MSGSANGFKPETVNIRAEKLELQVPQTRGVEFYSNLFPCPRMGRRSEWALKLTIAEMYVQGVSTRIVATITETLCGWEVDWGQVSCAAALLEEELSAWRNRPAGRDSLPDSRRLL